MTEFASAEMFVERFFDQVTSHEARAKTGTVLAIPASVLQIEDSTDSTKVLVFDVASLVAGTTATFTLPPGIGSGGVLAVSPFAYQTAAFVLPNDGNLNACFTAAQDTFTAVAATTYLVDAFINLTTGATTHTTAFGLLGAGAGTTFTSVNLHVVASSNATGGGLAAAQNSTIKVGTAQAVTATSTAVDTHIRIAGSFQVLAGGTIIPSVQFSADPTGTCQTNIGSFFRLTPIGSNAVVKAGAWA